MCKCCRTCFMFYCRFYFTCDRSLNDTFCCAAELIRDHCSDKDRRWMVISSAVGRSILPTKKMKYEELRMLRTGFVWRRRCQLTERHRAALDKASSSDCDGQLQRLQASWIAAPECRILVRNNWKGQRRLNAPWLHALHNCIVPSQRRCQLGHRS